MLRQESGTDKTNIVARTSKVILADRRETSVKLQSSNSGAKSIGLGKEAYLDVEASSKRDCRKFRENFCNPALVRNTVISSGT